MKKIIIKILRQDSCQNVFQTLVPQQYLLQSVLTGTLSQVTAVDFSQKGFFEAGSTIIFCRAGASPNLICRD